MTGLEITSLLKTSIHAVSAGQPPLVTIQQSVLSPGGRLFTVTFGSLAFGTKIMPGGPVHVPVSSVRTGIAEIEKPLAPQTSVLSIVVITAFVVTSLFMTSMQSASEGQPPRVTVQHKVLRPGGRLFTVATTLVSEGKKVTPEGPVQVPVSSGNTGVAVTVNPFGLHVSVLSAVTMTASVVISLFVTSIQAVEAGQLSLVIVQQSWLVPNGKLFTVAVGLVLLGRNTTPVGPDHVPVSSGNTGLATTTKLSALQTSWLFAVTMTGGVLTSLFITVMQAKSPGHVPLEITQQILLAPSGRLFIVAIGEFALGTNVTPGGPTHVPVSPANTESASTTKPFPEQTD